MKLLKSIILFLCLCAVPVSAQDLDINQIVDKIYARDSITKTNLDDLTIMAETFSRKLSKEGEVKEEKRFVKKYLFKDTLFAAQFLEFYIDDEIQDEKAIKKEKKEMRKKGRFRNAARNALLPFYPKSRENYNYEFLGIEVMNGFRCYHVLADCDKKDKNLIEGDYWFETDGFNLVYCEFRPAKNPWPIKEIEMKQSRILTETGYWFPDHFIIKGYGKVLFLKKFYFEGEEFYFDYQINTGLTDDLFREADNED